MSKSYMISGDIFDSSKRFGVCSLDIYASGLVMVGRPSDAQDLWATYGSNRGEFYDPQVTF